MANIRAIQGNKFRPVGQKSQWLRTFAIISLVLVVGFTLYWFFFRNTTFFRQDQAQLQSKLESIRGSISLPGELIYDQFQDSGCTSNTVGLQVSYACGYSGFRLYKNDKDLTADVQAAEDQATKLGFKELIAGRYLDGTGLGKPGEVILDLHSYGAGARKTDYTIKELIDEKKLRAPTDDEYIYGFRIGALYYSCTNESFFKQPCPRPESLD